MTRRSIQEACEPLERRLFLAASAVFDAASKTLNVTGTDGAEMFVVSDDGTNVRVDHYIDFPNQPPDLSLKFPLAQDNIQNIKISMLGGNDRVDVSALNTNPFKTTIDLGDGNDTVNDDSSKINVIGGAGNDSVACSLEDLVSFDGGAGTDTINDFAQPPAGGPSLAPLDLNKYPTVENANTVQRNIIGNALNNVLTGGADASVTISGNGGNDTITGGNFRDSLNGGDGNDSLNGGNSIDTVNGAAGTDTALNDGIDSLISIENKIAGKGSVQVKADGTLLITGTDGPDDIRLTGQSSTLLTLNGVATDLFGFDAPAFPAFTRIQIQAGAGDDFIGGFEPGGFPTFPDIVFDGGSGNDDFVLNDTAASVIGGPGDDVVHLENSVLLRGFSDVSGIDTIEATQLLAEGNTTTIDLTKFPTIENVISPYSIIGNDLDNLLIVQSEDVGMSASGGKGNDTIISSSPDALISGGDGNDYLRTDAQQGGATLDGGAGTDTLTSGRPDALENATYKNGEVINPPAPANPITGDANGNLTVTGTDGADDISILAWRGGSGGDAAGYAIVNHVPYDLGNLFPQFIKPGGTITVLGKGGNDHIEMHESGAGVRGYFDGGSGNDTLIGGSYNDTLLGGAGDDTLDGRGGSDLMKGGDGSDTADYSSRTANLTIGIGTLADDGEAGEHDNVYLDIEKVKGGSGNDRISGSAGPNVLYGGKGNDTLLGNGGKDALFGQDGNDSLDGGDDNDYLDGGSGNDTLTGGSGIDSMFGFDGNDKFFSQDGNKETLEGGLGTDSAHHDASDILHSIESSF